MDSAGQQRTGLSSGSFSLGASAHPPWLDGAASVFGAPAVGKALGSPANLQEPALLKAHGSVTWSLQGARLGVGAATHGQQQMAESSVHGTQGSPPLFHLERAWRWFSQSRKLHSLPGSASSHQPSPPASERRIHGEKTDSGPSSLLNVEAGTTELKAQHCPRPSPPAVFSSLKNFPKPSEDSWDPLEKQAWSASPFPAFTRREAEAKTEFVWGQFASRLLAPGLRSWVPRGRFVFLPLPWRLLIPAVC